MTLFLRCNRQGWSVEETAFAKKVHRENPESVEDLLEHRTDGTDAFDTLYIGCEKFPQHDFYGGISLGGMR